jgi:Leucine-rich repeat (LRR) protein
LKLKEVSLGENKIEVVEKRAFVDLDELQYLDLDGNKITSMGTDNVLVHVPRLDLLTMANNNLDTFNMDCMDQVGSLANFRLDLSHNALTNLSLPENLSHWKNMVNVRFFNLSHNNISKVEDDYLDGLTNSLVSLDLSHNAFASLDRAVFGRKPYLQIVDLSHNRIKKIKRDASEGSWNLLDLNLAGNLLEDFPEEFFKNKTRLRVVDLSDNHLKAIPEGLLENNRLEVLKADRNLIDRFPDFSLKPLPTLRKLTISGNKVERVRPSDIITLRGLVSFDVSNNRLDTLDAGLFGSFHKILEFHASGNQLGDFDPGILDNLEDLEDLSIAQAGLLNVTLPPLPTLLSLNVSHNQLTDLDSSTLGQVPFLKELDVSGNNLTTLDSNGWMMIPFLRRLRASHNPVTALKNSSLVGLQRLQLLDIRRLAELNSLESGAFAIMPSLKWLMISDYPGLGDELEAEAVVAKALSALAGIEGLKYDVMAAQKVGNLFPGPAPPTLKAVEISGDSLVTFKSSLFSVSQKTLNSYRNSFSFRNACAMNYC